MSTKQTKNYEELKPFIPNNGNDENYALLTHYLQMEDTLDKENKFNELVNKYGFSGYKLAQAEKFYDKKNIPFKCQDKPKFTFIDLFAGIGGFRLAMEANGGKCVYSSEWDDAAKQTYYANYGEVPYGDITKPEVKSLIPKHFDVLCAGFPCQAFSMMGEQKGFEDARGTMFFHIAEIVQSQIEKKSKTPLLILENVRSLQTHDKGKTFKKIYRILTEELKYNVFYSTLNSADYGVPQTRNRTYIVCCSNTNKKFEFPKKIRLEKKLQDLLEKDVNQKYFLSDKILPTILSNGTGGYKAKSEIDLEIARPLCATMAKMHRACQDNYVTQNGKVRRLTPRECARLQGFDDAFHLPVSDSQLYKQLGNAVTVNTINAVAKSAIETLLEK